MNRRNLLKTAGLALAGSAILPSNSEIEKKKKYTN
jgi:hypothetical protein